MRAACDLDSKKVAQASSVHSGLVASWKLALLLRWQRLLPIEKQTSSPCWTLFYDDPGAPISKNNVSSTDCADLRRFLSSESVKMVF
jgi:hypothetical protein